MARGRPTGSRDRDCKQLWNLSVPVIRGYLTNKDVSQAEKVRVALELVKKLAPEVIEHSGDQRPIMVVTVGETPATVTVNPVVDAALDAPHVNGR